MARCRLSHANLVASTRLGIHLVETEVVLDMCDASEGFAGSCIGCDLMQVSMRKLTLDAPRTLF